MSHVPVETVTGLVEHLFRRHSGQIVASLTRALGVGRITLAEEASQEAMLRAIQSWPFRGVPANPGGWLMQTARNLAIDRLRREHAWSRRAEAFAEEARLIEARGEHDVDEGHASSVDDDLLAMMFFCNHPSATVEGRVALTLKVLCGFSLREISRAFLIPEKTVAQRVARAKRRLRHVETTVRVPTGRELVDRRESVLTTLYLVFTEGYSPHDGADAVREELCFEAIRLLGILAAHPAGDAPETHALLALMWLQASRLSARIGTDGAVVLLPDQDRSRWDGEMIQAGMKELQLSQRGDEPTSYHLQAAIAACHASATSYEATNWSDVVQMYEQLTELDPSPIVRLNRAIAISMLHGPGAGIAAVSELRSEATLRNYPYLTAALAECYMRQGDRAKARELFIRAMATASTGPERRCMATRAQHCASANVP